LYRTEHSSRPAGARFSHAPVILLFLALQREFIHGRTRGAVKQ